MKKIVTFILGVLICICGYAQTIDPALLEEMGQRRDNEKIRVFVIMRQQYDQQQLNNRAAHFTTRAARREFVVNELKQFAETSQYDLRHSLAEMQRNELVSEPQVLWIANAIFFEATRDAILSLANRSDIMVIGFDEERNWLPDGEDAQPADPTREITSNVTQVNADQVWNLGYTGQGVVVAVIDTGVNYNHLDLADHLWDGGSEFPYHGYDIYNNDNNPMDDHGHGTHCAGTVCGDGTAGSQTGMAPDATLMCVKCLGATGSGYDTQVMSAMQWAVDHGCDVLSLSLGGHGHSGASQTLVRNTCVNILNAGVIASIAAGNEGDQLNQYPVPDNVGLPGGCPPPYLDPQQALNPGGLSCSVCVGAVNSSDQAADFTSHGPRDWSSSDYADYPYTSGSLTEFGLIRPDVCAPGVYIKSANYSSNTGYSYKSGTSMATPCVAGCMALMLSKDMEITPADMCRILEETAVPLTTEKSNIYGYGRVDVLAAINAMHSGPLTLDSFTINDAQGNNDGKLNAGEAVTLNFTLTNNGDLALDGATMVLTTQSEYVTITNGTASLPHFNVGQTRTINDMFAFTLSDDAPAKRLIQFRAETFVNGESMGSFMISIMVYGHVLRFVEVTVLNDNNGNGSLEAGETANLHVTITNVGNEPASSIVGTLSTTYPYLVINSNNKSFGTIDVNGQASANFNVSLSSSAPDSYEMDLSLDLVDANQKHTNVEFELWRKAITLTSNPEGAGTLSGGGYYGQGETCTITATANPGYAFVKWTLNGSTVSYLSAYSFEITGEAEYVAHFQEETHGVVIGDGSGKNSYLPTCVFNQYALTQQIYTADELNLGACDITGVSFFNTSSTFTRNLTVYMVNTSKTSFNSNTDWITVTEDDQVYSGSFTFSGSSWTTIYFDTVFVYDGSSNIALIVDDNSASMYLSTMSCRVSPTVNCQALCAYNLFTNYNPYNPTYSGTQYMEKNQVIFGVASYDYTVTVSANPSNGGTVSGGGGLYYYGQPITLTATPAEGYVFNSWTKNGTVASYFSTAQVSVTETAEYVANFQQVDGVAIGDAVNSNSYLPDNSYYSYGLTQQIYTADELNLDAGNISSVSFFNTGYNVTRNYTIYMVNTDKTVFENNNDWIPVTENDQVFTGSVSMTSGAWVTIYFSTPFAYDGSSNVALIVDNNTGNWNSSMPCRTFDAVDNQAIRICSDDINYDPYDPTGYSGTLMSMKNQVIFGIPSYDYTVNVSANPTDGGTVSGGGLCYYGQPVTLTATPTEGYIFTNWTKDDEVVSYVSKYILSVTESAEYVAHFELAPDGIVIGDGTYTNSYLPTYSYYSLSEQIYTASEMGGAATDISSVSFFNVGNYNYNVTRNLSIYMVNTDKASFEGTTDWIPVSDDDLVFSGNVTFTPHNWVTIYFNTPFNYDGTSNVALIVDDNSSSYNPYTSCRTFDTEVSQAIRINGSGTNYNPYNPTGYAGTLMAMKNQVVFGIPNYDYTVTVSANPTGGGTVSGGGNYYLNQPITLTATPAEGYIFSNWTKDGTVVSYVSRYNLTVTESAEYVAHFELAPDGIVIGDGTYTNAYLPIYYYYSLSEQIYTASEMGGAATEISSVSFFNVGNYNYNVTRNLSIYMVNTDKTSFEGTSDWIPVSDDVLVFSGNVTFTPHNWVTIYFNTPFNYDGTSNVALIVDDNSNSYNGYTSCRTFDTEVSQSIRIYSYNIDYDPFVPSSYTGTLMSQKNQVIFGIPSYDYTVTVSASPAEGGSVSGANGGLYFYGQPVTLTATANEGYVFNYWTKNGEIVSCLSNYVLAVTESAEYVAVFQQVDGVVIGDALNTNAYLPTYSYYPYSLSQQIYTADEMGGEAAEFYSLSFFNAGVAKTRNLSVYLVQTSKTAFESTTDWITVTEADLVFSGSVVAGATSWVPIIFDTPFSYDGTSNVALIVDDNTNYWNSGLSCRTFITDVSQALRISGSGTDYDPYAPTGYTGSLMSVKNQVIFHLPNTVVATANPTGGGTVSGAGSYAFGATCTLTATPNNGYYFLNWTENGNVVSYDIAYSFVVDGDRNLVANFVEGESNCSIVFDLYSSWGSGWYDNYLVVDYGNGNIEQITLPSGSSISYTREVATGSTIALSWIAGYYPYQCSFDIKFENGVLIYHGASLNANFQQDLNINCAVATAPHIITAVADPEDGGTVDGAGTYEGGTVITMTATPNTGYSFVHWKENGTVVSTEANYSFIVSSDRNLVAFFSLPLTVSVTTNLAEGGTVSGAGTFDYGSTCTLTATPNEGYLFLNWSKNGVVVSCNASYTFAVTEDVDLEAVFMLLEGTLIGQGEATNNYLPSYSTYNYTLSQQIYTPAEIGEAGNITTISYFNAGVTQTRSYDIYMVHTDKSTFDSNTDWITVSEADRVYSGSVTITKGYWTTIVLDTPFAYNGTSNLAIIVDDNTGTWSNSMACRVYNANGYQAIRVYSDPTNYDPSNPSEYNGTRYTVKNQIILGKETVVTQTIALSSTSVNYCSFYVDITLADLQTALTDVLGTGSNVSITIKSQTQSCKLTRGRWTGQLATLDLGKMYKILVNSDCEITLEGMLVDPADHPVTINGNGEPTWIAFPFNAEMTLTDAFAGFAVNGDVAKSRTQNASYTRGRWNGQLSTLEPGQGYIYKSASNASDRIFTYPTSKK